jgi:hypothetical protein
MKNIETAQVRGMKTPFHATHGEFHAACHAHWELDICCRGLQGIRQATVDLNW